MKHEKKTNFFNVTQNHLFLSGSWVTFIKVRFFVFSVLKILFHHPVHTGPRLSQKRDQMSQTFRKDLLHPKRKVTSLSYLSNVYPQVSDSHREFKERNQTCHCKSVVLGYTHFYRCTCGFVYLWVQTQRKEDRDFESLKLVYRYKFFPLLLDRNPCPLYSGILRTILPYTFGPVRVTCVDQKGKIRRHQRYCVLQVRPCWDRRKITHVIFTPNFNTNRVTSPVLLFQVLSW